MTAYIEQEPYRPTPNARFWVYHNKGWVRITLTPGQSMHLYTDDGYSATTATYTHTGDGVDYSGHYYARDCDNHVTLTCPLASLSAHDAEPADERYPDVFPAKPARPLWEYLHRFQRDYTAEAAGY